MNRARLADRRSPGTGGAVRGMVDLTRVSGLVREVVREITLGFQK